MTEGNGKHWITGVSVVAAFAAFFWGGMQWQMVQEHGQVLDIMDKRFDRVESRLALLERDHSAAIPALKRAEEKIQALERRMRRLDGGENEEE